MNMFLTKPTSSNTLHPSLSAEVHMAMLLVHHNSFLNLSDHMTKFITKEFKGSAAAEKFACGRTKTAAIVNCIGAHMKEELVESMRAEPFSIMLDASNDTGLYKMFPVTVRIFDINFGRIMTKFLDMNMLVGREASTAQFEFDSIDELFTKHELKWENVTGLGVDNTNSNIGPHNSIKQKALLKNKHIYVSGCPCHILHNAASAASTAFSEITKFDIEDHSVDLFYWFNKSSKRKSALLEYYEFCDQEYEEVIRYVSTRWLCLEHCVNRELKKYEGLRSYFLSEGLKDDRFVRLETAFTDPMTELYLFFFQSSLVTFTNYNKFLQREDPLIYLTHSFMNNFMNKLATKFVKPEVIQAFKETEQPFSNLDISLANQKSDRYLFIGFMTRQKLNQLLKEDIDDRIADKFFDAVRGFYETAYNYCRKWLPLNDPFLKHCQFINFDERIKHSFVDVTEIIKLMPHLHGKFQFDVSLLDQLEEEVLAYQGMEKNEIPQYVWDQAAVYEKETIVYHRMDIIWAYLRQPFPLLSKIALSVLTIPHSNAAEERVFSMIKKNKTEFRANLSLSKTLDSIMVIKMNHPEEMVSCYNMKFSEELLKKCKLACHEYNKEHSSK